MKKKTREIIDTFSKFWDEDTGYLKYKANLPTYCQGDILFNTGIVLTALSIIEEYDKDNQIKFWKDRILNGIRCNFKCDLGYTPRTVFLGKKEPKEPKEGRWERICGKWCRTDVSHSQWFCLFMGLYLCKSYYMRDNMIFNLIQNKLTIKNMEGEIVPHGNFNYIFGNIATRLLAVSEVFEKTYETRMLNKFKKFLIKVNLCAMRFSNLWQNVDANNITALSYFLLLETNDSYRKNAVEWHEQLPENQRHILFELIAFRYVYNIDKLENLIETFPVNCDRKYIFKKNVNYTFKEGNGNVLRSDLLLLIALAYKYGD